ncbi:MAG: ribonuclease HII [Candidatus Hydrogenedentota bacterium]
MSTFVPYAWKDHPGIELSEFELEASHSGLRHIAGIDEAGRGPLAGPVVAGAVMLAHPIAGVDDSKKLTEKKRDRLYDEIQSGEHAVGVSIVSAGDVDKLGIQQANYRAMLEATEALDPIPEFLLVDGFAIPGCVIPHKRIVKGDQRSQSIAAASIVAKVTRDRLMIELDGRYPEYGFARHKGYGTKVHLEAIAQYGPCAEHRKSFAPIANAVSTAALL